MAKWKKLEFSISQVRFSTSNSTIQGCGEDQGWLPCAGSMIGASMMSSLIPTEALGGEWHSLSSARVPWIVRGQGFGIQVLLPGTHVTQLPRVPYHTLCMGWLLPWSIEACGIVLVLGRALYCSGSSISCLSLHSPSLCSLSLACILSLLSFLSDSPMTPGRLLAYYLLSWNGRGGRCLLDEMPEFPLALSARPCTVLVWWVFSPPCHS